MRKLTVAILGLICAVLFVVHSMFAALLMLGVIEFSFWEIIIGIAMLAGLAIHGVLSLPPALVRTVRSGHYYIRQNRGNLVQMAAGALLLFFVFYHGYYLSHEPDILSLILMIAALTAFGLHVFIGVPKGLLTLGLIREERGMAAARIISFIAVMGPALFTAAAFIIYYPQYYSGG